jgi:hypothetical protein
MSHVPAKREQDGEPATGELARDESFALALQLLELTDMRAEGTITEEEFALWREELLPS